MNPTERFFVHRLAAEQYLVAGFSQYGCSLLHVGEFTYPLACKIDCYAGIKNGQLWVLAQTERGLWWRQKISQRKNQLYVGQTAITSFKPKDEEKTAQFSFLEHPAFMKLGDALLFRHGDDYISFHLTSKSLNLMHYLPPSWQNLQCGGLICTHFDHYTAEFIQNLEKIYPKSIFVDVNNQALHHFQHKKEISKKIKPWKGSFYWKLFSFHYIHKKLVVEHPQWTGQLCVQLPEIWNKDLVAKDLEKKEDTLELDWNNWPLHDGSTMEKVSKIPLEKTHWLAKIAQLQKKYSFLFQDKAVIKNYAALLRWIALLRPLLIKFKPRMQQKLCSFFIPRSIRKTIQPLWLELAPLLQKSKNIKEKNEFYSSVIMTSSGSVHALLQDNMLSIKEHSLWYAHWKGDSLISYWRMKQWLKFAWFSLLEGQAKTFWGKYWQIESKTWIRYAKPLGFFLASLLVLFPLSLLDPLGKSPASTTVNQSTDPERDLFLAAQNPEQQSVSQPATQGALRPQAQDQDYVQPSSTNHNTDKQKINEDTLIISLTSEAEDLFYNDQFGQGLIKETVENDTSKASLLRKEKKSHQNELIEPLEQQRDNPPQAELNPVLTNIQSVPVTEQLFDNLAPENTLNIAASEENRDISETFPSSDTETSRNTLTPSLQKSLEENTHTQQLENRRALVVNQGVLKEQNTKENSQEEKVIGMLNIDTNDEEATQDKKSAQQKLDSLLGQTTSADQLLRILTERLEKEKQLQQQLNSSS